MARPGHHRAGAHGARSATHPAEAIGAQPEPRARSPAWRLRAVTPVQARALEIALELALAAGSQQMSWVAMTLGQIPARARPACCGPSRAPSSFRRCATT